MAATKKHRKIVNQKPASFRVSGSGAARRKALVFEKVYPNEPISLGRANTLGVIILGKIISGDVKFLEPADSVVFPSEASIVPLYYFAETLRGAESSSARAERFRKSEAALDKMPDALDDLQEPFKTKGRMILNILSSWLEPGTEVFIEGLIYMAVQFGSAPFGPAQTEAAPPLPADEEMAAREPTAIDGVDVDGGGIGDLLPELPLPELAAPELPASGLAAPMLAAPGLAAFEGFGRDLSAPEGSASPLAAPELSAVESSALEPSSPGHPSLEPAARHLASHHQDSKQRDSEQRDSQQSDSEQRDFEQRDSEQRDSELSESELGDSDLGESERSGSEQSGLELSDADGNGQKACLDKNRSEKTCPKEVCPYDSGPERAEEAKMAQKSDSKVSFWASLKAEWEAASREAGDGVLVHAKPVKRADGRPAEQLAEQSENPSVEGPAELSMEQSEERPVGELAVQSIETSEKRPVEGPAEQSTEQSEKRPVGGPAEQSMEQSETRLVGGPAEQSMKQSGKRAVGRPRKQTIEQPEKRPIGRPRKRLVGQPAEMTPILIQGSPNQFSETFELL